MVANSAFLVQGFTGDFYLSSSAVGGDCFNVSMFEPCGTVFSLTPTGFESPLTVLSQTGWGSSAVTAGSDGNLYGVTESGGSDKLCDSGCGSIFKASLNGTLTYVHSFSYSDGAWPLTPLTEGKDGSFYGVTYAGGNSGCYFGCGEVFKVAPAGDFTVLHAFEATEANTPYNSLALGSDGNFYGTTTAGGANGSGTVFKVTPSGQLVTLSDLIPGANTSVLLLPNLVQGTDGNLYGVTFSGGSANEGTAYRVTTGLSPFVKLLPVAAAAGSTITIFGTAAGGATRVTFGGVPASFTQVSPTSISAVVPGGVTNGTVEVTTATGTLRSNLPFQVLR